MVKSTGRWYCVSYKALELFVSMDIVLDIVFYGVIDDARAWPSQEKVGYWTCEHGKWWIQ